MNTPSGASEVKRPSDYRLPVEAKTLCVRVGGFAEQVSVSYSGGTDPTLTWTVFEGGRYAEKRLIFSADPEEFNKAFQKVWKGELPF